MVAPNPSRLPSKQPDGDGWKTIDVADLDIRRVISTYTDANTRLLICYVFGRKHPILKADAFRFVGRRFTWEDGAVCTVVRGDDGSVDVTLAPGARLESREVPGEKDLFDVRLLAPAATP